MRKVFLPWLLVFLCIFNCWSQESPQSNPDNLLLEALEAYKNSNFNSAALLARKGLKLAPEYHDLRILKIRSLWALEDFAEADEELSYLLLNAPDYPDVNPLVHQRLNLFQSSEQQLEYILKMEKLYPEDVSLLSRKAELLVKNNKREEGRKLARKLLSLPGISGAERYALQLILTRSTSDEIGVGYQYIGFSEEYPQNVSSHNLTAEYLHNFRRTSVIGRINQADRGYEQGILYEVEAYPVFSDRFYAFTNVGVSNWTVFPDVRTSLSLYYNFLRIFEAEAGGRLQKFMTNSYFTGVAGLSLYEGDFYFNVRSFFGPERFGQLDQNYQVNVRYYFRNADNYLFLRLGSGISPDERILSTQELAKPALEASYGMAGINFSMGIHHLFKIGGGILREDIQDTKGIQYLGNLNYRYRF